MIRPAILTITVFALVIDTADAQWRRRRDDRFDIRIDVNFAKTIELSGVPAWLKEHDYAQAAFTFVRIRYEGFGGVGNVGRRRGAWATDFPDADVNLSAQFRSLTKLEVQQPKVLRLTDPELNEYPFVYMAEAGAMQLNGREILALRDYLNRGGFLLIDDFWGDAEWNHLCQQMKRVFPDCEPHELPLIHPLFNCAFKLTEKPQLPAVAYFLAGENNQQLPDTTEAHYKAIFGDDGRIMVLMCHNTDLGDGWENAGTDERYTREVSKKWAFPMGINILHYALSNSQLGAPTNSE